MMNSDKVNFGRPVGYKVFTPVMMGSGDAITSSIDVSLHIHANNNRFDPTI